MRAGKTVETERKKKLIESGEKEKEEIMKRKRRTERDRQVVGRDDGGLSLETDRKEDGQEVETKQEVDGEDGGLSSPSDCGARGRWAGPGSSLLTVRSASTPPLLFSMQVYTVDPGTTNKEHTHTQNQLPCWKTSGLE